MQVLRILTILLLSININTYSCVYFIPISYLKTILDNNPSVLCQTCFDPTTINLATCDIAPEYKTSITFDPCFILTIPNGTVQSPLGYTLVNKLYISEMIWTNNTQSLQALIPIDPSKIQHIPGRVAVITQINFNAYSHWISEILGRLALLEINNIAYDKLYVPTTSRFMKETLELWGIDFEHIISPTNIDFCIQAQEIILPSFVINTNVPFDTQIGLYAHPQTSMYVRNKLINAALQKDSTQEFSKKIFISRKDAPIRKITNEDEIFEFLRPLGFKSYQLSAMSVADQIKLFHQAEIVIGEHGTGLCNILFCQPGTHVIEIFQDLIDTSFWYMSNIMNLQYHPWPTSEIIHPYIHSFKNNKQAYVNAWTSQKEVSLEKIKPIVNFVQGIENHEKNI